MSKMMRIAILFFVILYGATGCSPDRGQSSSLNTGDLRKTVTLLSFPDQPKEYFVEAISAAKLDFDVKIIEVPQNQYEDKVHMMLMAQEATDLILMDAPNIASYAVSGVLEPLDSYWDKKDFDDLMQITQKSVCWNGHVWASPLNEASCLLFYNKRIFEEAGITVPASLNEAWDMKKLLDTAKLLTKRDSDGNIVQYGIQPSMFTNNNMNEGMAFTQMLYIWWFGGDILSPDNTTATEYFNSPRSKDAIRYYGEMFYKYHVAPSQEVVNGFENGKIAMWINGPWLLGIWRDNFPEFYENGWGAMPLPRGVESVSPNGSWNIAITKQSKNKSMAWKAIEAVTGREGMKIWCDGTGNIPARESILDGDKKYSNDKVYLLVKEQLKNTSRSRPITPAYPDISEAVVNCFNRVAHGENIDDVVDETVKKINNSLEVFKQIK